MMDCNVWIKSEYIIIQYRGADNFVLVKSNQNAQPSFKLPVGKYTLDHCSLFPVSTLILYFQSTFLKHCKVLKNQRQVEEKRWVIAFIIRWAKEKFW